MVQLPAMNTPQFSWVKSPATTQPEPVPPILSAGGRAEGSAICCAQRPAEMYVGYPTVEAIVADKIAPGFADWYLAKNGYGCATDG